MELCKAILLKIEHYSDSKKIIYAYSFEKGYLSFISSSYALQQKNHATRFMEIVEIGYLDKGDGHLMRLNTISPLMQMPNLYFDVIKMNVLLLWGEVLCLLLKHETKNETLFRFICHSIEYLNAATEGIGNFNLLFFYRIAGLIGFKIDTSSWQEGSLFHIKDACFYSPNQKKDCISGPNTAAVIYKLCTYPIEEVSLIPLNQASRNILLDIILLFLGTHLNVHFNIKSIQIIREIFQEE